MHDLSRPPTTEQKVKLAAGAANIKAAADSTAQNKRVHSAAGRANVRTGQDTADVNQKVFAAAGKAMHATAVP